MAFESLISSISQDFLQNSENLLYLSFPQKMMANIEQFFGVQKENVMDLKDELSPLKPFLKIIQKNQPKKEDIQSETYKIQEQIFLDYLIENKLSDRKDMVILNEIDFEKKSIKKTVISLFKKMISGVWIIKNAQNLSLEAINILKDLAKEKLNSKIVFCFDNSKIENSSQNVIEFVDFISRNSNFYEINDDEEQFLSVQEKSSQIDFQTLYNYLKSCRLFLDLTQGVEISKWINSNIENLDISSRKKRYLFLEMAIISFFSGNIDESSFYLNNVVEDMSFDEENLALEGMIYMVQVMYAKNAFVPALKYCNTIIQHLENNKKSHYYALAIMWEYRITERSNSQLAFEKYKKSQKLLEEAGLYNNELNLALIMPWQEANSVKGNELLKPIVEKVIEKAQKLGNMFLLSSAYHWYGILTSHIQGAESALEWYYKCNEIRTQLDDFSSIVKIRNGISYEQFIRTHYKEAYNLINSFLDRVIEMNDYPEIIITLCNVVKIFLFSRHFDEAYRIIQKIIYLQHLFGLEVVTYNSFVPTYKDVLILKIYIDLFHGEIIHSKINLHNLETNLDCITPSFLPLLDFCWVIIYTKEKNLKEAEKYFKSVKKRIEKCGNAVMFMLNFAYYEYATVLEKNGFLEESKKYFAQGVKFANENNFEFYKYEKSQISSEDYLSRYENYEPISLNLELLTEKAEKERLMIQLHKRLRDSQFLNRIMNFSSNKINEFNYINNVAQATFDYMMADAVFIAIKEGQRWKVQAAVTRIEIENPVDCEWEQLLSESAEKPHTGLFFSEERKLIFSNLSKFDFVGAVIIVPSQNINFTMEDLSVIDVAFSSLQAQIVMMKQNEHLMFVSSTDQLSMLKNRRALQDQISIQTEMIRRYGSRRDVSFQTTIVFIDLDNFKYYNDTFGHEAGDLLIQRFGFLLRSVFRKVDFISRFGGDEFVCLLPNTNCTEARRAAERLHEALENSDYFVPDLCQLLGKNVVIPDNLRIGFSTGICSNFELEDQTKLDNVLICADHALYYAKEHKKGSIVIWDEIKENFVKQDLFQNQKNTLEKK